MIDMIADYFKTQPVLKAWLFGSYARGEETSDSDVDVLFVPDRSGKPFTLFTMAKMYQDLKGMLDKEVDWWKKARCGHTPAQVQNRTKN